MLLSKVVLEEPEGYRGRRRRFRFPFGRKAGGAALPALLVAASVVVILIVIGVSQLLPERTTGWIPSDRGGGTVTDVSGQPVDPANPDAPTPGGSARPSGSPSPTP
jgi:hypothetical protein